MTTNKSDDYNMGYTDGIALGYEMGHEVGRGEGLCDAEKEVEEKLEIVIQTLNNLVDTFDQTELLDVIKLLRTIRGQMGG
jgi:flagellar biosynthesis/type III secretory pathway protein FliH